MRVEKIGIGNLLLNYREARLLKGKHIKKMAEEQGVSVKNALTSVRRFVACSTLRRNRLADSKRVVRREKRRMKALRIAKCPNCKKPTGMAVYGSVANSESLFFGISSRSICICESCFGRFTDNQLTFE